MNDITRDQVHVIEGPTEQALRSDFMHASAATWHWNTDPDSYDPADELDYREYAGPWLSRDDRWNREWMYLSDATARWCDDAQAAQAHVQARDDAEQLTPIQRRSEDQARYLAEHGIERDAWGLLTSHYVTRLHDLTSGTDAPASPLAGYRPGNALVNALANSERDGVQR